MSGIRNLGYMLRDIKKRRIAAAVTVLVSLLAVFVVYSVLNRPGVAMTTADCISYDAEGYPVVTIPEDAEVVATGENTNSSYNCKFTLYDVGDGTILYLEPIDPSKTYTTYGIYSYIDKDDKSNVTAIKAAPGLATLTGGFSGSSFPNLEIVDLSECPELSALAGQTFISSPKLKYVTFAQDCKLKTLSGDQFYNCKSLELINFSSLTNLESIGKGSYMATFESCAFKKVDLSGCTKLKTLNYAFYKCKQLTEVIFPDNCQLTTVTRPFDQSTNIESVDMSGWTNLTEIPTSMFAGFSKLETVLFPDLSQVTEIGSVAFSGCTVLDIDLSQFSNVETVGINAFSGCKAITEADLSSWTKLTAIPAYMFSNCSNLQTVIFPENNKITSIGNYAFNVCTNLETFNLPENSAITSIGNNAFYNCSALKSFPFENCPQLSSLGSQAFMLCSSLKTVDLSGCDKLTSISGGLFRCCVDLSEVKLPQDSAITSIGASAFSYCKNLSEFPFENLPNLESIEGNGGYNSYDRYAVNGTSVTSYRGAFAQTMLKNVDLSKTKINYIGGSAFYDCNSLETFIVPENSDITYIGTQAFSSCDILKDFPFEKLSNVENVGTGAFEYCKAVTEADLSSWTKLKTIADSMFYQCSNLETVKLPESNAITSIGSSAFNGCTVLKDFPFDKLSNVETVAGQAFRSCKAITEADLSSWTKLQGISQYMFASCSNLEAVIFPEDNVITSIEHDAFYDCSKLEDFSFENLTELKSIGYYAFQNCGSLKNQKADLTNTKLESLNTSSNYDSYLGVFKEVDCTGLKTLTTTNCSFAGGNLTKLSFKDCTNLTTVKAIDSKNQGTLTSVDFSGCSSLTALPDNMFSGFKNLKTVKLDGCDSLATIGSKAFYNCSDITEITLPAGLTTIGNNAFEGCIRLQTINYEAENMTSVGADAFKNLGATKDLTVNIGANVDTVCEGVFAEGMKIKTVNFKGPNESLVIGKDAFKSCGKPLAAMSDGVTEYYVDENGVVYSKDKTTLYYVPAGIETFTVPAHVTTVKSNCIAKATDLKTLAFEDISKLTKVESRAFANRPTLTRVTAGAEAPATTVEAAEALFAADTAVGKEPYYNTGLIDADFTGELTSGMVKDTTYNGEAVEFDLSLHVNNDENLGTLDKSCMGDKATRVPSIDEENINKDVYYYLTQEDANLTVSLSAQSANVDKCARVFFKCSNDAVLLHNFDVDKTVKISTAGGEGDSTITYDVTLRRVEGTDTYYLEFPALYGGTLSMDLSLYVPNLTEQNTTVKTWVQLCDEMDSPLNLTPEKYQELHWYTAIHKTTLKHTTSNTIFNFKQTEDADGNKKVVIGNDITFNTSDTITTSNVDGFGIDPVRTIGYSQYLTLPEGIEWDDWVKEAIKAGKWYVSGTNLRRVMLETEKGDIELMEFTSAWNAVDIDLKWDDEKGVVLSWNRLNPNLGASSGGSQSQEIGGINTSFTFNADEIFKTTEAYDFSSESKIVSNISNSIEHVFAEKGDTSKHTEELFEQNANASATLGVAKPDLAVKKSRDPLNRANKYGGEECDWIIEVTNNGIVDGNYSYVYDKLPYNLTMRAEHIEKMFAEYGNVLQLTIDNVYCNTATKEQTVIDSDGNKKVIDRNDVGTNSDLTALTNFYMRNNFGTRTANVNCDIAFRTEDGGKTLIAYMRDTSSKDSYAAVSCTIGEGCDYASVQAFFDAIGFVDYSSCIFSNTYYNNQTRYRCDWLEEPSGDNQIGAGETRTYHIYSEYKHIFENEYTNERKYWGASSQSNTAYVCYHNDFSDGSLTSKSHDYGYISYNYDFAVYKTYSSNGKASPKEFVVGDVVDYRAEVRKRGTDVYDTLPVYDTLSGSQAILVPVEGNDDAVYINSGDEEVKLPEAGLKIHTEADGTKYYILAKEGTYKGVMFGEIDGKLLRTDKITVKKNNYTLDTVVYWYLSDLVGKENGYVSYFIDYKTILREDLGKYQAVEGDLEFGRNDVYLNRVGNHQLYDYVGGNNQEITVGQVFEFDKNVVIANAALENEELSKSQDIIRGQSVTYKLELHNTSKEYSMNITGAYDMLPQTYGQFAWSKDNVSMKAISSLPEGNTTADVWRISDKNKDGEETGRYYIYWNDSETDETAAKISLKPNESLYIYVTLTFPSDAAVWSGYENDTFDDGNKLINSFYVGERKASVEHQIKASGEGMLQKGVYGIYRYNQGGSTYNLVNTGDRNIYKNQALDYDVAAYYVTIYNSGNARLYLTDITDVLPKGFEYTSMFAVSDYGTGLSYNTSSEYYYSNQYKRANNIYSTYSRYLRTFPYAEGDKLDKNNLLAYVEDGDRDIQYMQAYIKEETVSTKNADGEVQQKLKFSVLQKHPNATPSNTPGSYTTGNIKYDEERGLCYLEKGQALVFGYNAKILRADQTDDLANNRIAMQYYDYNDAGGFRLSQNVDVDANYADYLDSVNDGSSYLTNDFEASTGGFDGPYGGDWLTSDVALNRGQIIPGVEKTLSAVVDDKGESRPVSNGALISPSDIAVWTVTMTNDGTNSIDEYTVSDEMQAPYYFTGDISYYLENGRKTKFSPTYNPVNSNNRPTWKDTNPDALMMDVKFVDADGNEIEDSIENLGKENVWVKFKTGEQTKQNVYELTEHTVALGEECTFTSVWAGSHNTSWNVAKQQFTVLFDVNEKGNCTLDITVRDHLPSLCIPVSGKAVLTVRTKKPASLLAYDSYVNTANLAPVQHYEADAVSKGAVIRDENDNPVSVESTSMLTLSGAYATISWKDITDNSDPTNTASSLDTSDNYIVLKWDETKEPPYSDFTYSLNVQNRCNKPLYKMVVIDNLPDKGDFAAYSSGTIARNSQFEVSLTGTDVFTVSDDKNQLERVDRPSETGELAYTVEFSCGVEFTDDDWSGNETAQWMSFDETNEKLAAGELSMTDIRSYRIIVSGDADHGITEGGTLRITANARISGESVKPNEIAWNNFGYKYYVNVSGNNNFALSASSLNVGVKTATIPKIKKELRSPTGAEVSAERLGLGAEFIVYENKDAAQIQYNDDQDLLKKLDEGGYKFTSVKLTPDQLFDSDGDGSVISLTDCKIFKAVKDENDVYSCVESEGEDSTWKWTEDSKYTFVEVNIPKEMVFATMNSSQKNGCTITYKPTGSYTVYCINNYNDYAITLRKTDSETRSALSGAAFARYGVLNNVPENEADERMEQLWSVNVDKYIEASQMLNEEGGKRLTLSAPNVERLNAAKDISFADFMDVSGVSAEITDMNDAGNGFCQFYTSDNGDGTLNIYYFIDYNVTDERGYASWIGISDDSLAFREIAAPQGYRLSYAMIAANRTAGCGETQYIDIADLRVAELPMTGGSGTLMIVCAGIFLMLSANVSIIIRAVRRRKSFSDPCGR